MKIMMRFIALALVMILSGSLYAEPTATLSSLTSLQWYNRIILVNELPESQNVKAVFEQHKTQLQQRDIVWFIFDEQQLLTNYSGTLSADFVARTKEQYQLIPGKIMLIGKDGGVKFLLDRMDLEAIFTEIDAMPMRQHEMLH
ncbi:DUF4174 domain-containing protein [Rheinheimera mesophila]|uniref:DUF4174 domain-containing protein n=1 Tax=Rheinheimera mesophila TaxID=1547515 RepID=A0A3P3QEQ6_9GAMM|nr:DUF4174 domain-containing protein [Rheinheimera mesophila]RRJ19565.1 DUF4174 domain-containing protein [Rheinheimera mesophila]